MTGLSALPDRSSPSRNSSYAGASTATPAFESRGRVVHNRRNASIRVSEPVPRCRDPVAEVMHHDSSRAGFCRSAASAWRLPCAARNVRQQCRQRNRLAVFPGMASSMSAAPQYGHRSVMFDSMAAARAKSVPSPTLLHLKMARQMLAPLQVVVRKHQSEPQFNNGTAGTQYVRLTRKLADRIDGVDLTGHTVGETLHLQYHDAQLVVAEGWGEIVAPGPSQQRRQRGRSHE